MATLIIIFIVHVSVDINIVVTIVNYAPETSNFDSRAIIKCNSCYKLLHTLSLVVRCMRVVLIVL